MLLVALLHSLIDCRISIVEDEVTQVVVGLPCNPKVEALHCVKGFFLLSDKEMTGITS